MALSNDDSVLKAIARYGVVPVVVIDAAEDVLRLADALLEGGLPLVEITFRTAAAGAAISTLVQNRPEMLVGAGTVLTCANVEAARASAAEFAVAPGLNPAIVRAAHAIALPFVPGVATPSEMEQAMALGCGLLKYFPAEALGGADALQAMAGPYEHTGVRFLPTGGVNLLNLASYLARPCVAAVGGTWIAKQADLAEGRWAEIRDRCKAAVELVAKIRG